MLKSDPSLRHRLFLYRQLTGVVLLYAGLCAGIGGAAQAYDRGLGAAPANVYETSSVMDWACLEGKHLARDDRGREIWLNDSQLMKRVTRRTEATLPMLGRGRIRGSVVLELLIDEHGRVQCARAKEGKPLAVSAVLEAVAKWVFKPYNVKGRAESVLGVLKISYDMKGRSPYPGIVGLRVTHAVKPTYPALAAARNVHGVVQVDVQIDAVGKVRRAASVSGPPLLRPAAENAALGWRFDGVETESGLRSARLTFIFHSISYVPKKGESDFTPPYQMAASWEGVAAGYSQTSAVSSQGESKAPADVSAPIVRDKPAPDISFIRAGKRYPVLNGESDKGIWLRLRNNTPWAVSLDMSDIPQQYGDANLFYEVLAGNKVVVDMRCHVCSNNKLASGKSIVFSVPREYLDKDRAIRISFNYERGLDDPASTSLERQHYVYFYASNLSKAMSVPSLESHSRPTIKKEKVEGRVPATMPAGSVQPHNAPPPANKLRILKFEVDGKQLDKPVRVILYVGKQAIEPAIKVNTFVLPPGMRKQANVGVRVLCDKYDLFFDRVTISSFDVDWIVGVDHKPFTQEYVEPETAANLRLLYYISFVPRDADGSRLVVRVHK